ncbi:Crp/Fnr family transcriptional regulator [Paracoccus sp. (in: a-proteobacteria)]|uniref:Crp/Fnr family transcriptional regulator n=1 Tax=Paracoccus sp. TaxID=267 RepID=UPI00396C8822
MPKRLPRPDGRNHLISTLSSGDQALLQPHLSVVTLEQGATLEQPGQPITHIVFPVSGVTSIIVTGGKKTHRIEAGLFGREGMSGTSILLGTDSTPNELLVQIPGHALKISTEQLGALVTQSPSLHQHLLLFVQATLIQTTQTALSNKHNSLEERLARWLLMCHDRVEGDLLNLTHEFMSFMLGTRRAGVTVATQILEGKGLIRAKRGAVTILDREGLEEEAGGAYGVPEAEYVRLLGSSGAEPDRSKAGGTIHFLPSSGGR